MEVTFEKNNKLIRVNKASSIELEQLTTISTGKGYNYKEKRKYTDCMFEDFQFLPGGLWRRVLELSKKGYKLKFNGIEDFPNKITPEDIEYFIGTLDLKYEPRWYQIRGTYLALKFPFSRNKFATASGKSLIIYYLCRYLIEKEIIKTDQKILLIVPSVMLVNQMPNDFKEYEMVDEGKQQHLICDRIFSGGKTQENSKIVVGNIASLVNYDPEYFDQFGAVIVDEAHKAKTNSIRNVLDKLDPEKINFIHGLSGTFHEEKSVEELYAESYLGPVLMTVTAKQLMDEGSVTPLKIYQYKLKISPEKSYDYWHSKDIEYVDGRYRYELGYINSIKERNKFICDVAANFKMNQIFLFVFVEPCEQFAAQIAAYGKHKVFVIHGEVKPEIREEIKIATEQNDNVIICATYPTMDTGVSIKNLHYLHLMDSTKSVIRIQQSIGRSIRLHPSKKYATCIDWGTKLCKDNGWTLSDDVPFTNSSDRHCESRVKLYKELGFEYFRKTINI